MVYTEAVGLDISREVVLDTGLLSPQKMRHFALL